MAKGAIIETCPELIQWNVRFYPKCVVANVGLLNSFWLAIPRNDVWNRPMHHIMHYLQLVMPYSTQRTLCFKNMTRKKR